MSFRRNIFKVAAFGAVVTVGVGIEMVQLAAFSPESGKEFLEEKGYSNVTGGDRQLFHLCEEDDIARTYEVTNSKGQRTSKTVCKGMFMLYQPMFGLL